MSEPRKVSNPANEPVQGVYAQVFGKFLTRSLSHFLISYNFLDDDGPKAKTTLEGLRDYVDLFAKDTMADLMKAGVAEDDAKRRVIAALRHIARNL